MAAKPIEIAGVSYRTRSAVGKRLSALLQDREASDLITNPEDTALLSALFHARHEKVEKLDGREIIGWGREENPSNQCFAALLDTGEKLHFSFKKSLGALYMAQAQKA